MFPYNVSTKPTPFMYTYPTNRQLGRTLYRLWRQSEHMRPSAWDDISQEDRERWADIAGNLVCYARLQHEKNMEEAGIEGVKSLSEQAHVADLL